eukprot:TRINITY_DN24995_c0_g2_i1.p1 TRINITY_DN24995_c0_g2~~TRINITY_DN24995_c0_g2_i1.p1  ORF type:complete len:349 (-),score=97.33 TRINITY_DN24995_c0_g2_i1:40-1086(-)
MRARRHRGGQRRHGGKAPDPEALRGECSRAEPPLPSADAIKAPDPEALQGESSSAEPPPPAADAAKDEAPQPSSPTDSAACAKGDCIAAAAPAGGRDARGDGGRSCFADDADDVVVTSGASSRSRGTPQMRPIGPPVGVIGTGSPDGDATPVRRASSGDYSTSLPSTLTPSCAEGSAESAGGCAEAELGAVSDSLTPDLIQDTWNWSTDAPEFVPQALRDLSSEEDLPAGASWLPLGPPPSAGAWCASDNELDLEDEDDFDAEDQLRRMERRYKRTLRGKADAAAALRRQLADLGALTNAELSGVAAARLAFESLAESYRAVLSAYGIPLEELSNPVYEAAVPCAPVC